MPRQVVLRSRNIGTDVAQIEEMLKADYKGFWKQHKDALQNIAEEVQVEAETLVPLETGKLQHSIDVHVSKSTRYPGIIAHATAKNKNRTGFDYALIQEENEDYVHTESGRMAHYMGGPFARAVSQWYYSTTGKTLQMSSELQHAMDYIEEHKG